MLDNPLRQQMKPAHSHPPRATGLIVGAVGLAFAVATLFSDSIGLGNPSRFGLFQLLATAIGLLILVIGLALFSGRIAPTNRGFVLLLLLSPVGMLLLRAGPYQYWEWFLVITILGALAFASAGHHLMHATKSPAKRRNTLLNLWVSTLTLFLVLVGAEFAFKVFVASTYDLGIGLANRNWHARYWKPINALGYRDHEWDNLDLADRSIVVVLGDSFAAGVGIRHIEDRFSNVLAEKLGDGYVVMNAGIAGAQTEAELAALRAFPYEPDILILSYYINDTYTIALEHGLEPDFDGYVPPRGLHYLVDKSYLANFVYLRLIRLPVFGGQEVNTSYETVLEKAYSDPQIWGEHEQDLLAIYDWTREHDATLIVVVFPDMRKPEQTSAMTARVASLFADLDVPVIDLGQSFAGSSPRQLMVNPYDAHPSRAVHQQVGLELYEAISALPGAGE